MSSQNIKQTNKQTKNDAGEIAALRAVGRSEEAKTHCKHYDDAHTNTKAFYFLSQL